MKRESEGTRMNAVKEKFRRHQYYSLKHQAEVTSLQALTVLYLFLDFAIVRLVKLKLFISSFSVITEFKRSSIQFLFIWQVLCILVSLF